MKSKSYSNYLYRLTKGTDAGLYRLIPEKVEVVANEPDVIRLLTKCRETGKSVTFRAGGTSLSGQTITDSVLAEIGPAFGPSHIAEGGERASFSCHITGEHANRLLKKYRRKLGPSPASIKSARIGGIVANNASGSSYGILHNSYHTMQSMRVILADGFLLDTASPESCQEFIRTHESLVQGLLNLRHRVLNDPDTADRIRHKYELKNTCGYGVNALIDFEDPIDILTHLMVGSEGTLGFISQVTFKTIPDFRLKASALIYFPNIQEACKAIIPLRQCQVSAAELMDRRALRAVENEPGMPDILRTLPEDAVALLIDTSADDEEALQAQFSEIEEKLSTVKTIYPVSFTTDPDLYGVYWKVRSGLFTSAAAGRPKGTASIIEDIAFRGEVLGEALTAVNALLVEYGYTDAVMWGHLLDGNVHFTVFPDINRPEGVEVYEAFMQRLTEVVLSYDGSLKAEHGTGRNVAPFVRQEWGDTIYALMEEIKELFDPGHLLNPGVILNEEPDILVKNLKRMPVANDLIDKCIECGFCEVQCPSRNLTLTPRQRIVAYRALSDMLEHGQVHSPEYRTLKKAFAYNGNETCATDGLCGIACPVGINTGLLIKELRWKENNALANATASYLANHMKGTTSLLRPLLSLPHTVSAIIGYTTMEAITRALFTISRHRFPLWTRYTPGGARKQAFRSDQPIEGQSEMVYFPACITRTMGKSADYINEETDVVEKTISLLHKAGYAIRYPEDIHKLCCGMAFSSKGFRQQAKQKEEELNRALLKASDNGRLPILCDMSPCLLHMRETLDKRLRLYEPVEFIYEFMRDRLVFRPLPVTVAMHSTCSSTKMGVAEKFRLLTEMCAEKVILPSEVTCCGWAGDRGFFYPELNASALRFLPEQLKGVTAGYSNSRTCEIGLTMNTGISYKSIVYLVDQATQEH